MEKILKQLVQETKKRLSGIISRQALIEFRGQLLGRKSKLQAMLKELPKLPLEKRKTKGALLNRTIKELEMLLKQKENELLGIKEGAIDESLPGISPVLGAIHPITRITDELVSIFARLGFEVAEGPEVETEANNFDLLNIPADHPSRDEWDTFWIKSKAKGQESKLLLRTHTSPVQIRYMKTHQPPIKIIAPGRTFRYEAEDSTHSSEFFQLEGLVVDEGISVADLKGVIEYFLKEMFGTSRFRLRPSFFTFTEPSLEVDMLAAGLSRGFLELMGAGMVHPKVLFSCGIDPKKYSGFAFGAGIDRMAMLKYGIDDIRLFLSGDIRFVKQFR